MFRIFLTLGFCFFLAVSFGASLPAYKKGAANDIYYLIWKITALEHKVKALTQRMNRARVYCYDTYTPWQLGANKKLMYLDRQNVGCRRPYFLAQFHLTRHGRYHVRYNYRCCKFNN